MFISIMHYIHKIPDVLINIILEYIPKLNLVFVNKYYYNLYHPLIKNYIKNYEKYVRNIIKRDNHMVFEKVVRENFDIWKNKKKYIYNLIVFNNYLFFIMHYCIENESRNCIELLSYIFKERNFGKNLHKKNVIKYIKWKN
jgi:hypothetical protein